MADIARESRDDVAAYLALSQVQGVGSRRLRTLLGAFGSAPQALTAPHAAIAELAGFSPAAATAIRAATIADGRAILDELQRIGAAVLLPGDPDFPTALTTIHDPPTALFVWGRGELLRHRLVAMVGSRDHSSYGAVAARLLASGVAPHAVVISGMARGLDAIAHTAALDAGGGSIGVLGNGFGVIYPAANRALYERMVAEGCLVTELRPGERPHAGTFPRRNRLISGLAQVVVLVEAAPESGAIITADAALQQGRTVLAVPGPITSRTSQGCNRLIQQGAKPALCVEDVLEELGIPPGARAAVPPSVAEQLSGVERTLWDALAERRHIDALVCEANADPSIVLTALTDMEMRGLVRQQAGMVFERM